MMKNIVAEISIKYKAKVNPQERPKITNSAVAATLFKKVFDKDKMEHKEMAYAMYLNRANRVLAVLLLSEGSTSGTVMCPRVIFQGALKLNASGIILCHNHPTGQLRPSNADIELTKKVRECSRFMDITFLDHLIISPYEDAYYSFEENNV